MKPGTSSKLDRQLEEAKKKCSESSTELTSLKKDNTTAEKKIADLEKQTRKLNDENKKLIAELEDEKAKVMALAEIREEDMGLDLAPPPRKKSRRSAVKSNQSAVSISEPKEPETYFFLVEVAGFDLVRFRAFGLFVAFCRSETLVLNRS